MFWKKETGGHNRRKACLESYRRIDSLNKNERIIENELFQVGFSKRYYFLCPMCGRKARYLYLTQYDGFRCRECAHLNYRSQQMGHRDRYVERVRIIMDKLNYDISDYMDRDLMICIDAKELERPKYMRKEKFNILIEELEYLQNLWCEKELKDTLRFLKITSIN